MDIKKSSEKDTNLENRLALFVKIYLTLIVLGFLATVYGITSENMWEKFGKLMITTTSVATTVIMVYFVALQTKATRDMAEKTSAQVQLTYNMVKQMVQETTIMNETLIEMKKDRMDIEYLKNEVFGYIRTIENMLSNSLREVWPTYFKLPLYSNSALDIPGRSDYQKQGLEERLKRKIQKLLEEYNINLEEYNSLVETVNSLRREAIDVLKEESEFMESLQRISNDEARKYKIMDRHIIKADILLEELVTLFSTEYDLGLSAPLYGRLGLNSGAERIYGLEVWNRAKQEFYEFLKKKPKIYNNLVTREKNLKELKKLTIELLESIHKMEEELFQSESKLEKKLMEL